MADDVILELNIREDEIDQLYTVVNPSELSTTDALRDRADSLHHESVNTGPTDDDIEMVKTLHEEPDAQPGDGVVMRTVRLDPLNEEEAQTQDKLQIEQPDLTSCQANLNESVNGAKPRAGRLTDHPRSPAKEKVPGTPKTPTPTPVPPKDTPGLPSSTAIPEEIPPKPGAVTPLIA